MENRFIGQPSVPLVSHESGKPAGKTIANSSSSPNLAAYLDFLLEVLQAIADGDSNLQRVYPLLQENLNKLDDTFIVILRSWATTTLSQLEPDQALIIAAAIVNFSNLIRSFPYGSRANNLEIALAGCEVVAPILTREAFPEFWATTQHILGITYRNRSKGNRAQNLEQAIACYQNALQVRTRKDFPEQWAETQNNLGNVYNERINGDRAEVEAAIAAFNAALEVRTREALPKNWATTQNNLGIAYYNRLKGERAENLEIAIACYQNALQVRIQSDFPEQWAETKNNLANAYSERIRGDRAENLEIAITAFNAMLQVYTHEAFPQDWAMTQNNLGETYRDRLVGERAENLTAAISAYQAALQVYTREAFLEQWAIVQNNLGIGYYSQSQGDRAENLERAISCYQNALQVRTPKDFPEQWADTQNNLGNAYSERIQGERAENLERAISSYQAALQIHTREAFPQEWAKTHNNLALIYRDIGQIAEATAYFHSALEVYTPTAFPFECLVTGRNLGKTAYTTGDWERAIAGFDTAIQAVEQSRAWASTDARRQEILSAAIDVYARMVQACLNSGQTKQALEYVERSKARNLVELLATRDLLPKGNVPASALKELERLRREIGMEQRRLDIADQRHSGRIASIGEPSGNSGAWFSDRTHLNHLQQKLDELIQRYIRPYDPTFSLTQKVESIVFEQIQQLLPNDQTALIEWYITGEKFFTFIVTSQSPTPIVWQSSLEDLQALENWANDYLNAYYNNKQQWQVELGDRLRQLAEILHLDHLPETCNQLIFIPHRFLHLFPLHALPLADGSCLLDRFPKGVRYAPSCQLLQSNQNRERPHFQNLFAVQNPTKDLAYADLEVATIRASFPLAQVLVKQEATKAALTMSQDLETAHCAHFSCHGVFNLESPLESALLLAEDTSSSQPQSDYLILGEIFALNLGQCRLVTLSACETGLTDFTVLSDEYVGLPSGFLYAGSPSVVSSLWTVNDLSTAFLMIRFYQNLQTADSVAVALNHAQLWLRDMTKAELESWVEENQLSLSPTIRIELRRRFHPLQDIDQPFQEAYHWAGFYAVVHEYQ